MEVFIPVFLIGMAIVILSKVASGRSGSRSSPGADPHLWYYGDSGSHSHPAAGSHHDHGAAGSDSSSHSSGDSGGFSGGDGGGGCGGGDGGGCG
jgi:hypothetical protein